MKTFKLFGGSKILDFEKYVNNYIKQNPEVEIYIGTDSAQKGGKTSYATAIVFYHPSKGAHIIYSRNIEDRVHDIFTRLWSELEYSRETAERVNKALNKTIEDRVVTIDLDVNPSEIHGSNVVYLSGVGYLKGLGYKVRTKPNAFAASSSADLLCK